MIVAFAATAFADVTLSGTYKARGNYKSNIAAVDNDSDDKNMYYDHDLDIWLKASTDKDTYFKSKIELLDGQWKEDGNATKTGGEIQVERAWLGHNFGVAKMDVGMMTGGAWGGYEFGNTADAFYRLKATVPAGPGNVIAIIQKNYEANVSDTVKDADKDDSDSYLLGYKGKFGGITVAPLLVYTAAGNLPDGDRDTDVTVSKLDLAVGGSFGAIGFETELIYQKKETENANDPTNYNLYANVFGKVAGAKIGFLTAYSSVDDDNGNAAMGMGEDFDDTIFIVLGDQETVGGTYYAGGLKGVWANALYAEYAINDKTGVTASIAHMKSNFDNDDTSAVEFDLGMTYKITKALKYGIDFGYAKIDADTGTDPDASILLQHYLKISF